jgi:SAM-dependent methyltransferase
MNVVELREFYASPLGKATHRLLAAKLLPSLNIAPDAIALGLGFATPYLNEGVRNLAFMMARQGVIAWPSQGLLQSALVDELDLPLPDNSIDVALVIHGLEFSESPIEMLQEVWRVLAPQGRLVLVVPNRRGLWAASDASPFGFGQPFSRGQLWTLLKEAQFSFTRMEPALVMPPRAKLAGSKIAVNVEKYGKSLLGHLSGVIVVEATKQIYAYSAGRRVRRTLPRFRPALLPVHHKGGTP